MHKLACRSNTLQRRPKAASSHTNASEQHVSTLRILSKLQPLSSGNHIVNWRLGEPEDSLMPAGKNVLQVRPVSPTQRERVAVARMGPRARYARSVARPPATPSPPPFSTVHRGPLPGDFGAQMCTTPCLCPQALRVLGGCRVDLE